MQYRNFDLDAFNYRSDDSTERFRVRVVHSPAGQQKNADAQEVSFSLGLRQQMRQLEQRELSLPEMIALGECLVELLFPPEVRSFLIRSMEHIREDEGLRIRLRVDAHPLADIPWEYIYIPQPDTPPDQRGAEGFLALNRRTSLVRYEVMGESPARLDPITTAPLRLVALLADPRSPEYPQLDLDAERRNIEHSMEQTSEFSAEFFPHATVKSLEDALVHEAQVFHFAGHGEFQGDLGEALGSVEGEGYLALVDESGGAELFPADKLAQNLRGRGVRLAVLGACEGGRRDQVNVWSGIAPALNRAGIPAVVGMQYTIHDENAIAFMRRLYAGLAAGETIDAAVADGRLAILNRGGQDERDWGVPVLYLRADQGVLFPQPDVGGARAFMNQLRPGKPGFVSVLASACVLLLSLLTGLNQLAGFFVKIALPTAALSIVLALTVALALPALLCRDQPEGERFLKMSYRAFAILLAALIILAGVGPYGVKYGMARTAKAQGTQYVDLNDYGPARLRLERAARYFDDLGLAAQAADAKVILTQVYTHLGEEERAEDLIAELEDSGNLSGPLLGKQYTIKGNRAQELGQFEQAERFYQLAHQLVEPGSQAQAILLQNQGVLWAAKGGPYLDRAMANYEQARTIYQALGDEQGLTHILLNEGNFYANDPEKARARYEEAKRRAEGTGDPYLLGSSLMNIGLTYRQQGDLDQAEGMYRQAQRQFEAAADLAGQAEVLVNQATVEWVRGRRELARQYLQTSEAYLRNIDVEGGKINPRKLAQIRTFQADIYDALGESETAEALYEEALAIYSQHPQALQEANTQINYGTLLLRLGQGEAARNRFERAREILGAFSGEGPDESLGVLYIGLGKANQDIGDLDEALAYYRMAADIFDALGDPMMAAMARENIGIIRGYQSNPEAAIEAVQQSREVNSQYENVDHEVKALFNLYTASGDPSAAAMIGDILSLLEANNVDQETEAGVLLGILPQDFADGTQLIVYRERLRQLQAFYEQRDEPINLGRSLLRLADVEQKLGNYAKMVEYARKAEPYANDIPLPMRIPFHSDLGWFLMDEDPQASFDHFMEAYDLAEGLDPGQQYGLAVAVDNLVLVHDEELDAERCYEKVVHTLETTTADAQSRDMLQTVADSLETLIRYLGGE